MSDPDRLAEIRQRRAELDGQIAPWARPYRDDIDWLLGEVARLRDLLARLEWATMNDRAGAMACPACDGLEPTHEPGCWLAAALAGNANKPPTP